MTNQINIKLDSALLDDVNVILKSMGLSLTDAVRIFLTRVRNERAIPFEIKAFDEVPNEETRRALMDAENEKNLIKINSIEDLWKQYDND